MLRIEFRIVCGILCGFRLCAAGQDAVPNAGDRLEAETAARLREFEKNHNMGGPRRPMSFEMEEMSRNSNLLDRLNPEDLAKMSLEDPLLKWSYYNVFTGEMHGFEHLARPKVLALADMRRRGEAVSPMLLKLMAENQETLIEDRILSQIGYLETVNIEPFVEYARRLLRERVQTMTVYSAGSATLILGRYGTKEDEALLEWVLKERPFVEYDVDKSLKVLRARLNPRETESRPERREKPASEPGNDSRPTPSPEESPENGNITTSRAKPWIIGGLILAVLLGACRLLFKRPRGA